MRREDNYHLCCLQLEIFQEFYEIPGFTNLLSHITIWLDFYFVIVSFFVFFPVTHFIFVATTFVLSLAKTEDITEGMVDLKKKKVYFVHFEVFEAMRKIGIYLETLEKDYNYIVYIHSGHPI